MSVSDPDMTQAPLAPPPPQADTALDLSPDAPDGICPLCERLGPAHTACEETICGRKGYHRLTQGELLTAKQARRHLDPLIGRRVGDWLVLGELGSGAFGTVFIAQRPDGLKAALKVLARPADDPQENASALKKFQLETDALGALRHPGIVGLYDSGTFEERPWLAMELVSGGLTLKKEIENRRMAGHGMPRGFALAMLDQLLDALHTAHTSPQRIVHRDIKPENLMLTPVAGETVPRLKVLDFGLAKFTESGTETSHALGTPAYMAPEQLWKRRIGPWTDLYAVGVIAFELLTGRRPFLGSSEEVVQKKSSALYDVLTEAEGLPLSDAAARFFRKALAFEVDVRYGDAPTLGADLRALPELQGSLDYSGASATGTSSATASGETARGEAVDLDTERQRLERMQQQMEAERRRLEDERRKLDSERSQMSASVPPSFAPPTITPPGSGAGGGSGGGSSSKGGLFLGLAGGVLLVGIGLVFGRAWLTGSRDDAEGADGVIASADAGAEPAAAVVADTASAAVEEVAAVAAVTDDVAAGATDQDAAVAAAAATDDVVAAAQSDSATDPAAAAAAAADAAAAAVESADTVGAVAGPADTLTIQATAGSTAPEPAVVAPVGETKPVPKPVDPKVLARKRAEEARRKAEAEAKAKEAARQAAIADEFRRTQERRQAEIAAKKRAEAERQKKILEEFKKSQKP